MALVFNGPFCITEKIAIMATVRLVCVSENFELTFGIYVTRTPNILIRPKRNTLHRPLLQV